MNVSLRFVRRLVVATWFCLAAMPSAGAECLIKLRNVTRQTGIDFQHTDGSSGRRYLVETVSAGLATFDYDGDGKIDIYFLNGRPLPGAKVREMPTNHLYRNLGGLKFVDVTRTAGVGGGDGYGLGVCVGDYDNDGRQDLYLNNFGENILYHNNGDGTFTDVTAKAGVGRGQRVGAGASFLDYDNDGKLDLFVGNYAKFTCDKNVVGRTNGFPTYVGPGYYPKETNMLFRNNGDGTFTDVSKESGIAAHPGYAMGVVSGDYDNDGHPDIFVANDSCANSLFHNDGRGKFSEVGLKAGVAYDINGDEQGNMGVDCGDYNHDGWLDFFKTSYQGQSALLYKNLGKGRFQDVTFLTGAGARTMRNVTWGLGFVDFENKGARDIFIVCGHLQDNIESYDGATSYHARCILMRNTLLETGRESFVDVSGQCGDGLAVMASGRGVAFEDFDNDGRVDVVVLNSRGEPTILRNESQTGNHWLELRLRGVKSNRDGVGARVYVVARDLKQMDEVHSGRGYQSHWGTRLHFGLGKHERIDRVEVHWPRSGIVDILEDVPADQLLTIAEGSSPSKQKPLLEYPQLPTPVRK
jgi:enediyne biosynthesis protein E4